MEPCQLTAGVTGLACAIFRSMSAKDAALLASILVQLGDTITTLLAGAEACGQ